VGEHVFGASFLDEYLFAFGQRLFEHDQDDVVANRGACFGWSAAGVFAKQPHDRVGQRYVHRAFRAALLVGLGRHCDLVLAFPWIGSRAG
jgi:hypothetical protein